MGDQTWRCQSLENIAAVLRDTASTLRLFSSSWIDNNPLSEVTKLSLQIDECAYRLDDLARKEADDAARSSA